MNYSFDSIDYFLALFLFRLFLRDKLDKVQYLAVQEQENVFDLQRSLAEPWISALVKFLCNSCFKFTTIFVFLLLI